jgi:hypothetical protein
MEMVQAGNITAIIFFLKARCGWRDQGPVVEVHNENNVKVETVDLDEITGKRKLLRDTIQVLRELEVPAALELPIEDFPRDRRTGRS